MGPEGVLRTIEEASKKGENSQGNSEKNRKTSLRGALPKNAILPKKNAACPRNRFSKQLVDGGQTSALAAIHSERDFSERTVNTRRSRC